MQKQYFPVTAMQHRDKISPNKPIEQPLSSHQSSNHHKTNKSQFKTKEAFKPNNVPLASFEPVRHSQLQSHLMKPTRQTDLLRVETVPFNDTPERQKRATPNPMSHVRIEHSRSRSQPLQWHHSSRIDHSYHPRNSPSYPLNLNQKEFKEYRTNPLITREDLKHRSNVPLKTQEWLTQKVEAVIRRDNQRPINYIDNNLTSSYHSNPQYFLDRNQVENRFMRDPFHSKNINATNHSRDLLYQHPDDFYLDYELDRRLYSRERYPYFHSHPNHFRPRRFLQPQNEFNHPLRKTYYHDRFHPLEHRDPYQNKIYDQPYTHIYPLKPNPYKKNPVWKDNPQFKPQLPNSNHNEKLFESAKQVSKQEHPEIISKGPKSQKNNVSQENLNSLQQDQPSDSRLSINTKRNIFNPVVVSEKKFKYEKSTEPIKRIPTPESQSRQIQNIQLRDQITEKEANHTKKEDLKKKGSISSSSLKIKLQKKGIKKTQTSCKPYKKNISKEFKIRIQNQGVTIQENTQTSPSCNLQNNLNVQIRNQGIRIIQEKKSNKSEQIRKQIPMEALFIQSPSSKSNIMQKPVDQEILSHDSQIHIMPKLNENQESNARDLTKQKITTSPKKDFPIPKIRQPITIKEKIKTTSNKKIESKEQIENKKEIKVKHKSTQTDNHAMANFMSKYNTGKMQIVLKNDKDLDEHQLMFLVQKRGKGRPHKDKGNICFKMLPTKDKESVIIDELDSIISSFVVSSLQDNDVTSQVKDFSFWMKKRLFEQAKASIQHADIQCPLNALPQPTLLKITQAILIRRFDSSLADHSNYPHATFLLDYLIYTTSRSKLITETVSLNFSTLNRLRNANQLSLPLVMASFLLMISNFLTRSKIEILHGYMSFIFSQIFPETLKLSNIHVQSGRCELELPEPNYNFEVNEMVLMSPNFIENLTIAFEKFKRERPFGQEKSQELIEIESSLKFNTLLKHYVGIFALLN